MSNFTDYKCPPVVCFFHYSTSNAVAERRTKSKHVSSPAGNSAWKCTPIVRGIFKLIVLAILIAKFITTAICQAHASNKRNTIQFLHSIQNHCTTVFPVVMLNLHTWYTRYSDTYILLVGSRWLLITKQYYRFTCMVIRFPVLLKYRI